jgi:hypothetical protein
VILLSSSHTLIIRRIKDLLALLLANNYLETNNYKYIELGQLIDILTILLN